MKLICKVTSYIVLLIVITGCLYTTKEGTTYRWGPSRLQNTETPMTSTTQRSYAQQTTKTAVTKIIPESVNCEPTKGIGLSIEDMKALKYLIEKKYKLKKNVCIEQITAIDKFKLKGNFIIKYKAVLFFPVGYRTECLDVNPSELENDWSWSAFNKMSQNCNAYNYSLDPLGGPKKPGARLTIEGDEEI